MKRVLRDISFGMLDLRWDLASGVLIRIRNLSDWAVYNEVFVSGDYDSAILVAIETANEEGELHIVDLGANVGFFVLRCVDLVRRRELHTLPLRITAIEGNPNTYDALCSLVAPHTSELAFKAINGLVGKRVGSGAISDQEHSGLNQLVTGELGRHCLVNYVDVEEIVGSGSIGLLKCDIEGAELAFLENYPELLKRTKIAVLELHTQKCDESRCISLLSAAGLAVQINLAQKEGLTKVIMASRLSF
jgi:FkbM family methyltransferase